MRIINRLKRALYIILNILLNLNSSARFTYATYTKVVARNCVRKIAVLSRGDSQARRQWCEQFHIILSFDTLLFSINC